MTRPKENGTIEGSRDRIVRQRDFGSHFQNNKFTVDILIINVAVVVVVIIIIVIK